MVMSGARLRRRLDRIAGPVRSGVIVPLTGPDSVDELARRAGVSPAEVVAEARRIDALCRAAGAWTTETCLAVVAADGAVPVEMLRAGITDLQRARGDAA